MSAEDYHDLDLLGDQSYLDEHADSDELLWREDIPGAGIDNNWECMCGFWNFPEAARCMRCGRFQMAKKTIRTAAPKKGTTAYEASRWVCSHCFTENSVNRTCRRCKAKKPTNAAQSMELAYKRRVDSLETQMNAMKAEIELAKKFNPVPDESPFQWKDGRGKMVHPREMEEEHLRNSVSFCQRRLQGALTNAVYLDSTTWLVRALYEFLKECKRRKIRV